MRGLTIIVADLSSERFRCALELAAAQAALGGQARIFLQGDAVMLLRSPIGASRDEMLAQAGLPTLDQLFQEAMDLGVQAIACQSGLAITRTAATMLDRRCEVGGLVSLLQTLGEDRLISL